MNIGLDTKIRAGAGALALTLLLAGCATGPAYVRPSVDVPGAFKERPAGTGAPRPSDAAAAAPQSAYSAHSAKRRAGRGTSSWKTGAGGFAAGRSAGA